MRVCVRVRMRVRVRLRVRVCELVRYGGFTTQIDLISGYNY